ncbi:MULTISPECIES: ATP-grasp fold amidoligase family protein [unclassified Microbacterium]|uniref:ATP-grasp fold amidoligase family protein n=1 Tax=unclassified Microbacterium TaxID=2609290 RepID=UPI0030188D82
MALHIHLDGVVGDFVKGWAVNDEAPERSVDVEVSVEGTSLGVETADLERRDLTAKGLAHTRIGFRSGVPAALLDGTEREFTARVAGRHAPEAVVTKRMVTTRLAFSAPAQKPWVASLQNQPRPLSADHDELPVILELFRAGQIDEAIGIARRVFRSRRELFGVDTGIVDALAPHGGVKSFEELMADRRHDWFESDNHSLWQSKLEKKEAMQHFARRNLVQIPSQIAHFTNPEELLDLDLPSRYVAKPDGLASAKGVFAVSGGVNTFTGSPITRERIVANWRRLAAETERIDMYMVEEFVTDRFAPDSNAIPLDYKIYVFGGTAGFLEVFDRNHPSPSRTPYAIPWKPLPHPLERGRVLGPAIRRPDNLEELIDVAERLGRDVGAFCRVDLFNGPSGPVLGEITTLPANGKNRTAYADRITQQAYVVFEDQQLWSREA